MGSRHKTCELCEMCLFEQICSSEGRNAGNVLKTDLWNQVKAKYITVNHVSDSDSYSSADEALLIM